MGAALMARPVTLLSCAKLLNGLSWDRCARMRRRGSLHNSGKGHDLALFPAARIFVTIVPIPVNVNPPFFRRITYTSWSSGWAQKSEIKGQRSENVLISDFRPLPLGFQPEERGMHECESKHPWGRLADGGEFLDRSGSGCWNAACRGGAAPDRGGSTAPRGCSRNACPS
jgi:hypothetical protein